MARSIRLPGLPVLWLALVLLVVPLPWILAWGICVAVHELGHLAALWIFRVPIYSFQIGINGARIESGPMTTVQKVLAIGAGPVAGMMLMSAGRLWPELAVFAFVQTLWNLLPVYPMDGGRMLRILCPPWICDLAEKGSLILILLGGIWGSVGLGMGSIPLGISIWALLRLWKEKDLANSARRGYNIPNPNSEVCYDRINSADPAHGAETCPIHRR